MTPPSAPCVLLVDDNRDNREMYRLYLEWDGFGVVEATDGEQALDQALRVMPTVIVTDLALPRLNGWEAARRLKEDPRTRHIPVLAVSAHALRGDAERARAVGCDGYLPKPCLPEDLARAIRALIKDRSTAPAQSAGSGHGVDESGSGSGPGVPSAAATAATRPIRNGAAGQRRAVR
jgi:CheY-like chemotaxis protein